MKMRLVHGETVSLPDPLIIRETTYDGTLKVVFDSDHPTRASYTVNRSEGILIFKNELVSYFLKKHNKVLNGRAQLSHNGVIQLPSKMVTCSFIDGTIARRLDYSYEEGTPFRTYYVQFSNKREDVDFCFFVPTTGVYIYLVH